MRNSFAVRYSVNLWLASMGVTGILGGIVGFFACYIIGDMLDRGIVVFDISTDRMKQALKDPVWRDAAARAYKHAKERVYTEKEKDEIRKQYLAALDSYISFV